MKPSRDFLRFYLIPIVLFIGILATALFTVLYTATARTPDGGIVSIRWPREFTVAFSKHITCVDNSITVSDEGRRKLAENGLWLQVLDGDGNEVLQVDKPDGVPDAYQPYALLQIYQSGSGRDSVFVGNVEAGDAAYTYLIGFELPISKVTMYVDNARYQSGKILIMTVIVLTMILVVTLAVYSYKALSTAEARRRQEEKAKEEWLTNITHDLKTPLSPIIGYAELLAEPDGAVAAEQVRRYGSVILKNARYAEELVGDLRLTYQLKSGMLPLQKANQDIICFVREVVIDVLNAPEFSAREISFEAVPENAEMEFDPLLMKRALTNILVNALTHSGDAAAVSAAVRVEDGNAVLTVRDNGVGMTPQALENLFTRYYRGVSTEANANGSGLGMAIAKQIVEAHGGRVQAQSRLGSGTEIVVELPV